jgi:hypothetical protein
MREPELIEKPAPRRRSRLRWLGLIVLVLFGACGGFYGLQVYLTDRELREAMAETDRLEPDGWRLEEIEAHRKQLRDEDNAALVAQAVRAKLPGPWPPRPASGRPSAAQNDIYRLPPEVQIDDALLRDLRAELQAAGPALAEARKLSALREGRFPVQWARPLFTTVLKSEDARIAAGLLRVEATVLAQEGEADRALEATRGILVSARSVGDEPTLFSMFIRIDCSATAVNTLQRVLAQGEPSPAELEKMQELLEAEAAEPLLLIAARGERAGQHELLNAIKAGDIRASDYMGGPGDKALLDLAGPSLARAAHAPTLRLNNELVEACRLPTEQQPEAIAAFSQKVEQRESRPRVKYDMTTALMQLSVARGSQLYWREQALLRCAVVAVAAERYRRRHGAWPATAYELADGFLKAVPTDPADGKPLCYKRPPHGVMVYAAGLDKEFSGSAHNRVIPHGKSADFGFRLWDGGKRRRAAEVLPPPDEPER